MTKGSAWKSPFLLSTLVFVAGMLATICFSYFFFERAEKDWNVRVDQTAERLSNTLLAWLEESYAPVSGLMALVENSKTVEPSEFLNAFESIQSRSTTVLLDEAKRRALTWHFREGWPSKLEAPALNGKTSEVAIETLEICHEGLELAE